MNALKRFLSVGTVAMCVAACGGDDGGPTGAQLPDLGPGDSVDTFNVGGFGRTYLLHVPPQHDPQTATPLLLFFHGFESNGREFQFLTGLDEFTDARGWITVYPSGVSGSWAAGCDCTTADAMGVDDLAFVDALIEELGRSLAVDSSRIYAAGFSQGSQFIHHLACSRETTLAAAASIGATMAPVVSESCQLAEALPMVFIQGTNDRSFPWGGDPPFLLSLHETVERWVELNGCQTFTEGVEPDRDPNDGTLVRTETYSDCLAGVEVKLYSVERGGHTWPSSVVSLDEERFGLTSQDISASQTIVDFFSRFVRSE